MTVIHMAMLEGLRTMCPDNYVDSVVCDPPYGLTSARPGGRSEATRGKVMGGFMGLKWDYDVPTVEEWREVLRVLKPGGFCLAFGGTRTYHRLVCGIEDAGFEIRDQIQWLFGSGFPKSHNGEWGGTALKPANEPICVARKPLEGTVEDNWRKWGTGALAIDACRVETEDRWSASGESTGGLSKNDYGNGLNNSGRSAGSALGRWPANVIHDGSDEVLACFPNAPGQLANESTTAPSTKTSNVYGARRRAGEPSADSDNVGTVGFKMKPGARRLDSGSAARFFYTPKPSRSERNAGLEGFPLKAGGMRSETSGQHITRRDGGAPDPVTNHHPTVKPVALMQYLCRLVTPPRGLVLDPWAGSGTTGIAAAYEGFNFLGFDREAEYVTIANARIAHARRAAP